MIEFSLFLGEGMVVQYTCGWPDIDDRYVVGRDEDFIRNR